MHYLDGILFFNLFCYENRPSKNSEFRDFPTSNHRKMASKVLIFGGTGFLGSKIARKLSQTKPEFSEIILASRHPPSQTSPTINPIHPNISHHPCNIINRQDIQSTFNLFQPTHCINAVSLWLPPSSSSSTATKNEINLQNIHLKGNSNIIKECQNYNTRYGYISGLGLDKKENWESEYCKVRKESEKLVLESGLKS